MGKQNQRDFYFMDVMHLLMVNNMVVLQVIKIGHKRDAHVDILGKI